MKSSVLIILLLSIFSWTIAQETAEKPYPDVHDFIAVDKEPVPLNLYLIKDKIGYPVKALKNKIEGKVFSRVLVSSKGEVIKYVLTRNDHPALGEAVKEELESLRFQPAIAN
ncbi:MAG: energy transducer TonB, partial [Bacteroidota bacterium]